ncbi:hypothetical protein JXO59_04475 [candidate division KSB1 bacterium]|nr:hypothetical protein [candidate division KSB1 bacterium]
MRLLNRLKKITLRSKILIGLLIVLLLLEFLFDVFEIAIGMIMLQTNEYRPKVGRLWKEEEKDEAGQSKVITLLDSLSQIPTVHRKIKSLDDLRDYLAYKSHLLMPREEFITLYQAFPTDEAVRLLDSSLLYDLTQRSRWQTIRLSLSDDKISMLFLDSYGQPILDALAYVGDITHVDGRSHLQDDPAFRGRTIPGDLFIMAYQNLDRNMRLQIINDPRLYDIWQERVIQVGVARVVQNGSVTLAFEVMNGAGSSITRLQGSELAVSYLIEAVNQIAPAEQKISEPIKEDTPYE